MGSYTLCIVLCDKPLIQAAINKKKKKPLIQPTVKHVAKIHARCCFNKQDFSKSHVLTGMLNTQWYNRQWWKLFAVLAEIIIVQKVYFEPTMLIFINIFFLSTKP